MKVFIGWSGDLSRKIAEILRKYLPCMIQDLDVFMSKHDVESGSRWSLEIAKQLDETSFGILCLTPDNLGSQWIHFEAGALTKHIEGRACGLLIGDLRQADVEDPLSWFQNRSFSKDEIESLLRDINSKLPKPLDPIPLQTIFEKWWPDIEQEYQLNCEKSTGETKRSPRDPQDILEEILELCRGMAKREREKELIERLAALKIKEREEKPKLKLRRELLAKKIKDTRDAEVEG